MIYHQSFAKIRFTRIRHTGWQRCSSNQKLSRSYIPRPNHPFARMIRTVISASRRDARCARTNVQSVTAESEIVDSWHRCSDAAWCLMLGGWRRELAMRSNDSTTTRDLFPCGRIPVSAPNRPPTPKGQRLDAQEAWWPARNMGFTGHESFIRSLIVTQRRTLF